MQLLKLSFTSDVFEVVVNLIAKHLHFNQFAFCDRIELSFFLSHADFIVRDQKHGAMVSCESQILVYFLEDQTVYSIEF